MNEEGIILRRRSPRAAAAFAAWERKTSPLFSLSFPYLYVLSAVISHRAQYEGRGRIYCCLGGRERVCVCLGRRRRTGMLIEAARQRQKGLFLFFGVVGRGRGLLPKQAKTVFCLGAFNKAKAGSLPKLWAGIAGSFSSSLGFRLFSGKAKCLRERGGKTFWSLRGEREDRIERLISGSGKNTRKTDCDLTQKMFLRRSCMIKRKER